MNTLSKEFTLGNFFGEDPENYKKLRNQWKKMVSSDVKDSLTMEHHILYLILIGKDWKKAVTLPTNKNKLENHYKPRIETLREVGFSKYRMGAILMPFEGAVTQEMLENALKTTSFDMSKDAYDTL